MATFIVFEGVHGVGKSHLARHYVDHLCAQGIDAQYYHFPDEGSLLGQATIQTIADASLYKHWEITGLMLAAAANIFHIQAAKTQTVYVLDRHPVTAGFIFQSTMPDTVRRANYAFGIEALRENGIVVMIDAPGDIVATRITERNAAFAASDDPALQAKAADQFVAKDFDELCHRYQHDLCPAISALGIDIVSVSNTGDASHVIDQLTPQLAHLFDGHQPDPTSQ